MKHDTCSDSSSTKEKMLKNVTGPGPITKNVRGPGPVTLIYNERVIRK